MAPTAVLTADRRMEAGVPDGVPADAKEEISRFVAALPAGVACVATGSLIEGLGNENSDIDLYLIQPDGSAGNPISIGIRKARYVDCEYLTVSAVARLAERFANPDATDLAELTPRDFDRYYRTSIGIPMVADEAMLELLTEFTPQRCAVLFARKCDLRAYHYLTRAVVAHAAGDPRAARVLLREAWLNRAMRVLAEAGEGYPSSKWTEVKAARRFGAGTPEYAECLYGLLDPASDLAEDLAAARERIRPNDDVRSAFPLERWQLAENVRVVAEGCALHLIRNKSITRISGVLEPVITRLGDAGSWDDALTKAATELGVPIEEFRIAISGGVRELVKGSYLAASAAEKE
jgi:hypothetical protein